MGNRLIRLLWGCCLVVMHARGGMIPTYDAENEYWDRSDWIVEEFEVTDVVDLERIRGTHSRFYCTSSWSPPVAVMVRLPSPAERMAQTLAPVNGYLRYVINAIRRMTPAEVDEVQALQTGMLIKPSVPPYKIVATAYVFSEPGTDEWDRQKVISEGFDPENQVHLVSWAQQEPPLTNPCDDYGFDMTMIDYAESGVDIRENAKAYLAILDHICRRVDENASPSTFLKRKEGAHCGSVVSAGMSLGGIIARLGLLYGQKMREYGPSAHIENVRRYVSLDSPHQGIGAQPLKLQEMAQENNTTVYNAKIGNTASKQLLYEHIEAPADNRAKFHDDFLGFLEEMGDYPQGIELYAIADSHWPEQPLYTQSSYTWTMRIKLADITVDEQSITWTGHALQHGSYWDAVAELSTTDDELNRYFYMLNPLYDMTIGGGGIVPLIIRSATNGGSSIIRAEIDAPEDFNPTFAPVYSVLDIDRQDTDQSLLNENHLDELISGGKTPFDRLMVVDKRDFHINMKNPKLSYLFLCALDDCACDKPVCSTGHDARQRRYGP